MINIFNKYMVELLLRRVAGVLELGFFIRVNHSYAEFYY